MTLFNIDEALELITSSDTNYTAALNFDRDVLITYLGKYEVEVSAGVIDLNLSTKNFEDWPASAFFGLYELYVSIDEAEKQRALRYGTHNKEISEEKEIKNKPLFCYQSAKERLIDGSYQYALSNNRRILLRRCKENFIIKYKFPNTYIWLEYSEEDNFKHWKKINCISGDKEYNLLFNSKFFLFGENPVEEGLHLRIESVGNRYANDYFVGSFFTEQAYKICMRWNYLVSINGFYLMKREERPDYKRDINIYHLRKWGPGKIELTPADEEIEPHTIWHAYTYLDRALEYADSKLNA